MEGEQPQETRFRRTVRRLTIETKNMRGDFAARHVWYAWLDSGGSTSNLFLQGAGHAVQSDLMIRLIRVLDVGKRTASFWYLHRCGLSTAGAGIDFEEPREFSMKLKSIRDKTFVHIDKEGVFDPGKYYGEAGINDLHLASAIDDVWKVLCRLNASYGEPPGNLDSQSLQSLCQDFGRDLLRLVNQ
jgi:hypothetical protein